MSGNTGSHPGIIVIDDNPEFSDLLRSLLHTDYQVSVAADGSEGFQKALEHPPEAAIIDIQMPGWDGLRTLKEFRHHPTLSDVPVMILTADASRGTVLAALEAGANNYMVKTDFSKDELRRKLEQLLVSTPRVQSGTVGRILTAPTQTVAPPVRTTTYQSATQPSVAPVDEYDRTAERVLDTLDRWSDRLRGHHSQKRSQTRSTNRRKLTIYVPENDQEAGEAEDNAILEVRQRDASRSGVGFIYHESIRADEIIVCIEKEAGDCTYYRSQIVRRRQTHEGFWYYGVQFLEEVNM